MTAHTTTALLQSGAEPLSQQETRAILRAADLRPTRQRLALGQILFADRHRHVAAEELHREVLLRGGSLSLATVYNTLRHLCEAGLIRQVATQAGRAQFDTSASDHQHFYVEEEDRLIDIPPGAIGFDRLPEPPAGYVITAVDVLIRLRRSLPIEADEAGAGDLAEGCIGGQAAAAELARP
jgi:Fur family iron response transcriptional regulator